MGTTAEKLNAALISKEAVKQALTEQGFDVPDDFSTYADFINVLGLVSDIPIVTTEGSGAAYTATVPGTTELKVGMKVTIIPHVTSTSKTATLNLNGLGAKAIRQPLSTSSTTTTPLYSDSWLVANKPVTLTYNGTQWVVDRVRLDANTVYGTIPIANGGTGATTVEAAQQNLGIISQNKIPNLHVWKRYTANPKDYTETQKTNVTLGLVTTGIAQINYADSIEVSEGAFLTSNFETITSSDVSEFDVIKGNYSYYGFLQSSRNFYFIPSDATFTKGTDYITADKAYLLEVNTNVGTFVDFVASEESDAYPTSGSHSDGYWYEYSKQLGEAIVNEGGSSAGESTGGGTQVQSDYNQNDSTAVDFIKNRPFYEIAGETLFDEDVTTTPEADAGGTISTCTYEDIDTSMFAEGDTVMVTYDNETYQCVIESKGGALCLGNTNFWAEASMNYLCDSYGMTTDAFLTSNPTYAELLVDTGEPFSMTFDGTVGLMVYTQEPGTYHFIISKGELKQLDEKFIPDTIARTGRTLIGEINLNSSNLTAGTTDGIYKIDANTQSVMANVFSKLDAGFGSLIVEMTMSDLKLIIPATYGTGSESLGFTQGVFAVMGHKAHEGTYAIYDFLSKNFRTNQKDYVDQLLSYGLTINIKFYTN